ncbi:phage tail spike protein [Bacillus toyonensis]|uniref:phage tail spike protein n=1 Tax=Bacillus toyonensis TaxID=155322 RepID=UPI00285341BE|nr:phage tail spike protein [Bacillus toyonensis]MDR4970602.1 phage tail spike protein [Bacillus toyonensis]
MRTPSGDLHVVDFKTNQIVSDIQPKDYWDDKRHWEIKNNIDTLEFRLFENTDHATTLVQQNLVLKEVRGGRIVPYVITETEKDSKDRSLMVYASGEWIQLAKAGIIEPQKIESKTLKQCMEIALKGTKWTIGKTEHDGAHSMVIEEFTDPLDLLKKIAASFELEIQYRAEVVGSKIVGRYVDMVRKRGRDTRKEVTFGKDLIGIKRIENSQSICTALLGFVKKENGEFITISSINKGVPYLVDDAAYQRWNENGKHKFAFYTPQTDDQNMSPDRLLTLMKTEMSKIVNASVSYGVDAQNIARITGLSHEEINEGDTIRIIDEGFTPKLYLEARAIAGDESFKDPTQDNYVFGDYREIVDQNDELRRLYQKILSSLYDKVPQELFDQLNNKVKEQNKDIIDAKDKAGQAQKESQTAKDLAEATQDYMERNLVDIIESVKPPTANLKDGKTLWSDSSDPNNKVLKLWKGGAWVIISPDTKPLNTALTQAQNDITKAKQDITTNKGLLDTAKSELQGNINAEKQRITDLTTNVNKKVDKTWIDQQLLDKADKSGVYTKDYIDQNTIGKQVYETDRAGNVQKFTDMNTDITRNANAIKSKAEQSSLDTTNNNVTGVTNRVTTVEQTATGLTTRIGSAESKINTATGDISTLQTKTNTIEQTATGSVQKINKLTGRFDGMSIGSVNIIQGTEEIFSNPSATGNYNGFKVVPSPFPKYDIRNKEITFSMYFTGKITAKGTNPWLGMELGITFIDNTTQYLNGRIDGKITVNKDYLNERFVFVVKVNDKEIKSVNVTQGARDLTGSIKLFKGQVEEGNQATAWKLSPEELTTTQQFTQKTNEIINTVDQNAQKLTAVETTMKNTKYGRDNLIPNSGMFSNTGGWMANTPTNSTMEVVTEDGFNAMKIKGSIRASSPIILKPDTEYVYSALIKIPVDNVVSDGSGNPLHFWSTIGANPHTAVQRAILEPASKKILANTWTRVSYKFKTLAGAENTLFTPFMYSQEIINSNAFAYIRYFQLVEGNQITEDWQAPSGDIVKKTNEIVQTVDSNISRISVMENSVANGLDNLLDNSRIDNMTRWEGGVGINFDETVKLDGYNSIRSIQAGNTSEVYRGLHQMNIQGWEVGGTYTFSAYVRTDDIASFEENAVAGTIRVGMEVICEKADGSRTTTYNVAPDGSKDFKPTVNGQWQRRVIVCKNIPAGTTKIRVGVRVWKNGRLWVACPQFEKGEMATAFTPKVSENTSAIKTNEVIQTVDTIQTSLTATTNKVTGLETKTNTLEIKSNTMRSDLDGNITAINSLTETVTYAGENFLDKSSANNEFPSFLVDAYYLLNKATGGFFEDYYIVTCADYTDAFYQMGNSSQPTNMHGFKANDSLTLSMDLQQDLVGTQTVIFQHDGTSWSEAEIKTYNHAVGVWTRVSHSFTLKANTKGFMIRIRFPRVAGANTKKLRFRKLKIEYGSLATQWNQNSVEIQSKTNTIKQTTDENSMKLTSIDASGIAGANLVYNSDMLQRPTNGFPDGWSGFNTTTLIFQNPWADEPRGAVARFNRTNLADTDPNSIVSLYSNKLPVARNKDYTWSVWMYVPSANWSAFKVKNAYIMEYFDNAGTRVQYQDVSLTTAEQTSLQAGNWTRIVRTFRPTTAGITQAGFRLALFHNGDIYYRMPQVELGTVATGWNRSTVDFSGNYQFNDLNSRTNEIKQTLDGTVSTVSSLSSTVGTHTQQITQQGSTIKQMNNEIDLRVKSTEMTDYIGKLGAENELRNTAFETKVINATTGIITSRTPSLDKWGSNIPAGVGGSITAEATRNREGYNSAKIVVTGAGTTDRYTGINQNIPASISSGDYVFGAWFYVQDKALIDNGAVIKLQFFNGSTGSTSVQTELAPILVNNKWVYAEVKITAPATAITVLRADIWVRRNGTLWVSQPMLQYGSNASAFMEHPQDYVNYDALVGEVAKKVATTDYNAKISTIESSITQANNKIDLRVLATDVYKKTESDGRYGSKAIVDTHESSITLLKNQIISKVEAGGIASAINQTPQSVLIQAGKINLDGAVTAKSIQSQRLVGATISTLEQNQIGGFIEMNAQHFALKHRLGLNTAPLTRGYFGFMPDTGKGQDYVRTSLVLGTDYNNEDRVSLSGAVFIEHMVPKSNLWADASARIGIAKSRNTDTSINTKSEIYFGPTGNLDILANEGPMVIRGKEAMTITTSGLFTGVASSGTWVLENGRGFFPVTNRTLKIVDKRVTTNNDNADTDIYLGSSFMIRSANDMNYYDYGLQIKKQNGSEWANLWAGKIRASTFENTSSRSIKTGIKDINVDALEIVMALEPKEYFFKADMEKLYEERQARVEAGEETPPITTDSIQKQYGFIAEDVPEALASKDRKSVPSYPLATMTVGAVQKIRKEQLADQEKIASLKAEIEAEKLEEVSIQTELNELKGVLISQEERIAKLEELLLQQLINKKPEQP